MAKSGLPKSIRIFLRREKARIRRTEVPGRDGEKKINEIAAEFIKRKGTPGMLR